MKYYKREMTVLKESKPKKGKKLLVWDEEQGWYDCTFDGTKFIADDKAVHNTKLNHVTHWLEKEDQETEVKEEEKIEG